MRRAAPAKLPGSSLPASSAFPGSPRRCRQGLASWPGAAESFRQRRQRAATVAARLGLRTGGLGVWGLGALGLRALGLRALGLRALGLIAALLAGLAAVQAGDT